MPYFPITRWAIIRTQFVGYHCYPDAPEAVKFLRDLHRHMFHVKVWIEQFHNERDIEYILFLREVNQLITCENAASTKDGISQVASCETMAQWLAEQIQKIYPERRVKVEITEDGENGALVELERLVG